MLVIPRGPARSFRAVARKCMAGRPRGPAPPVAAEVRAGTLTLTAVVGGVGLSHVGPADGPDGRWDVPMAVFEAVDRADGPVELEMGEGGRGVARWTVGGVPRTLPFDVPPLDHLSHRPIPPADWHPVPTGFLTALHECGRTTAREVSARYALSRVQVRGGAGTVVGSDGRTALIWSGFDLPFEGDVLVPAVPVFGCKDLAAGADVRVGRTASHLAVAAGPWRVVLPVDAGGRYPDVAGVVPRSADATVELDDRDADILARRLPELPGVDGDDRPVTLDLDGHVTVRGRGGASGPSECVRLDRSSVSGRPARVAVDRRTLVRAIGLGCRTIRVTPGGKPVVFAGPDRTLVSIPLDDALVVLPDPGRSGRPRPVPRHPETSMTRPETNGRPRAEPDDGPDPLAEAEDLHRQLADAARRSARLVAVLKALKREKKVLAQAWQSLKTLNLGP